MADQPPLNDVLMGDTVKQMQDVSREEILRQIFGDIGELADGKDLSEQGSIDFPTWSFLNTFWI